MIRLIGKIVTSFFLFIFIWVAGLIWFVAQMPEKQTANAPNAGAIIVLTGGTGRIEHGINLLLDRKAEKLFISGANAEVSYDHVVRFTPKNKRDYVRKNSGTKVILGKAADNTIGNAEETKQWLATQKYKSILLVTSHYHMPRSISEFKALMPELVIIPEPVIVNGFKSHWWMTNENRKIVLSEYHKYLISKLRHWFIRTPLFNIT
ncbi:MAG: YdcF family protein [Alphaproteobacteria bacterium]